MSVHVREIDVAGKKLLLHTPDAVYDPVTGAALTGSWLWGSALVLAHWMAQLPPSTFCFQGKTVVELGAGTGLPGMVAALLGARRVVLTDVALLLPGLRLNVVANGLSERVEVKELVWGTTTAIHGGFQLLDQTERRPPDLILMSDLFYDPESMPDLARTLKELCSKEEDEEEEEAIRIWAATEMRLTTSDCFDVLIREGFNIHEEHETQDYAIFTLYPPPPCCE